MEIWKNIKGYEGKYQVSNLGNVKSSLRNREVILKQLNGPNGYRIVSLCGKSHYIHRLVAQAFIENVLGKPQVNHKDGNKANNCLENLDWVTPQENSDHAVVSGLLDVRGAKNPTAILSDVDVSEIKRLIRGGWKTTRIGRIYGVHFGTIRAIKYGKLWKHVS